MQQELSFSELLGRVQMHAADRRAAEVALARGEAIAAATYRATLAVQAAAEWIGRAGQVLGQRIRARFA